MTGARSASLAAMRASRFALARSRRLHPPPPAPFESRQRNSPTYRGSILDADPPAQGVKIACRMTVDRTLHDSGNLQLRIQSGLERNDACVGIRGGRWRFPVD